MHAGAELARASGGLRARGSCSKLRRVGHVHVSLTLNFHCNCMHSARSGVRDHAHPAFLLFSAALAPLIVKRSVFFLHPLHAHGLLLTGTDARVRARANLRWSRSVCHACALRGASRSFSRDSLLGICFVNLCILGLPMCAPFGLAYVENSSVVGDRVHLVQRREAQPN